MPPGDHPEDDVREAILGPAATGVIAPTGQGNQLEFGRYAVVASIGRGGMGEVYLARTRGLAQDAGLVALKVLRAQGEEDQELIGMFMDEASIMAQIHHPNVLSVFDFGHEREHYFLAMEYLMGRPLVRVMIDAYTREQGLDPGIIAAIGADAARGLHAAYTARGKNGQMLQVIHRDVSPQNIFVTYGGPVKVIDFGVAKASERVSKTSAGQLKGKAAYMSPEQINGLDLDGQSDVFALATCLWEMSAGRRLFKRESDWDTMAAVLQGEISPPSGYRPAIDQALDSIILDALERDRRKRTRNAGVLCEQLTAYAKAHGVPTDGSAVRVLMDRLYSSICVQERKLIETLEARAATEAEADALRQLSGIAPRETVGAVTLVARQDLADLDAFGVHEEVPTVQVKTDALRGKSLTPARADSNVRSANLPSPSERAAAIRKAVEALQAEHQAALVNSQIGTRSAAGGFLTQFMSALPYMLMALIAVIGVVAVGLVLAEKTEIKGSVEVPDVPATSTSATAAPPPEPALVVDPVLVDAPGPKTADQVIPILAERGVDVARLGRKLSIEDGTDSPSVNVDVNATFSKVEADGVEGWLALSSAADATSVVWMGSVGGAPWTVRGLSINDCPATAVAKDGAIEVAYGKRRVTLPPGGGVLQSVTLSRPPFARRMELVELGLVFLRPATEQAVGRGVVCARGWGGDAVRLENVPAGRYTVRWSGKKRVIKRRFSVPKRRSRRRR